MYSEKVNNIATIYDILNFCMQYRSYNDVDGTFCSSRCPFDTACMIREPSLYANNAENISIFNNKLIQYRLEDKVFAHDRKLFSENWFSSYPKDKKDTIMQYINRVGVERINPLLNRYYEDIFVNDSLCNTPKTKENETVQKQLAVLTW